MTGRTFSWKRRHWVALIAIILIVAVLVLLWTVPLSPQRLLFRFGPAPEVTAVQITTSTDTASPFLSSYTQDPEDIAAFLDLLSTYRIRFSRISQTLRYHTVLCRVVLSSPDRELPVLSITDTGELYCGNFVFRVAEARSADDLIALASAWD